MGDIVSTNTFYNSYKSSIAKGTVNLDTDTLILLLLSDAHVPDRLSHAKLSDIVADEIAGGTGYVRATLVKVVEDVFVSSPELSTGDQKLTVNPIALTASGGEIEAMYWAIFSDAGATDALKELICYGFLDQNEIKVAIADGDTTTFTIPFTGLITVG